jgi:hypothetical protein
MSRTLLDTNKPIDPQLDALANAARPISVGDDNDWGSERQTTAQNDFFTVVEELMHPMAWEEFSDWCLKATTDEMIDEALRLLREE